jgi:Secretion system C-terminal sorting domain
MKVKLLSVSILLVLFAAMSVAAQGFNGSKEDFSFQQFRTDPIRQVQIYPNPATEFINIKFEAPIANKVRVSVHNVIGNVMEVESESIDEHEIRVKVKDLSTGYYLLSVKDDRASLNSTYKFLKR